ncbi:MAG: riboflavin kinase [Eubacteriales bacterium]|nr:riboflavin kinase [Eubacteriales bacterium]
MKEKNISLCGKVVHGRGIGKLVGSPTANLEILSKENTPIPGVYASSVCWKEKTYYAVTHIGNRPTIDNDENISIEVHLLNFNQDIYGEKLLVKLCTKLREPQKFSDLSALLNQIRRDCIATRKFFALGDLPTALYMDIEKHKVSVENTEVFLSTKEFDILYLLYSNPDVTFSKGQIYQAVWHELSNDYFHAVENTIYQIRKKLRLYLNDQDCIKTVVGYGYKFQMNSKISRASQRSR